MVAESYETIHAAKPDLYSMNDRHLKKQLLLQLNGLKTVFFDDIR
jgi:hypothetical protein